MPHFSTWQQCVELCMAAALFFMRQSRYCDLSSVQLNWMFYLCSDLLAGNIFCTTAKVLILLWHISIIIIIIFFIYFFTLGTYNPEGDKKLKSKYKIGYDHQSVQSVAGKLFIIIIIKFIIHCITMRKKSHPIGSRFVNVKFLLGRAWLIGIVLPWNNNQQIALQNASKYISHAATNNNEVLILIRKAITAYRQYIHWEESTHSLTHPVHWFTAKGRVCEWVDS